jgi:hypothetical protein
MMFNRLWCPQYVHSVVLCERMLGSERVSHLRSLQQWTLKPHHVWSWHVGLLLATSTRRKCQNGAESGLNPVCAYTFVTKSLSCKVIAHVL